MSAVPRHRCFISYHSRDRGAMEQFAEVFSDRTYRMIVQGVVADDDFINSQRSEYVFRRIRERYLTSTTVTIVLVGRCTWARRFVDSEVAGSLVRPSGGHPNGLLAIDLSRSGRIRNELPRRVADNVRSGYAIHKPYPRDGYQLQRWIHSAWEARTISPQRVENPRSRKRRNSICL